MCDSVLNMPRSIADIYMSKVNNKDTRKTPLALKLVSAIFYQIFIFSPNDSPSKTTKNVFYFI